MAHKTIWRIHDSEYVVPFLVSILFYKQVYSYCKWIEMTSSLLKMQEQREKKGKKGLKEKKRRKKEKKEKQNTDEVKQEDIKKTKKHNSKKKRKEKQDEEDEIKQEVDAKEPEQSIKAKETKKKKKKRLSKSKPKPPPSPTPTVKSQNSDTDDGIKKSPAKKKQPGRRGWTSKEKRKGGRRLQNQLIEVESIKIEDNFDWSIYNDTHNIRAQTAKKEFISLEDSDRIIDLFSVDAGDYKALGKQMPHLGQRKIRRHLGLLFSRSLEAITSQALLSGRKIKDWEPEEKRQILRELHRIRSSNRLLSQQNVELRETFHKLMRSHNHPEIEVTNADMNFLYRKIEAFVRGYNHFSLFRKQFGSYAQFQKEPLVQGARKPLSQGGYIMQSKIKRDTKRNESELDPERLALTWREEEERQLCQLYLYKENNFEYMIENLRTKFGENVKWNDFQILGRKIDHLIRLGLDKLQRLTQISAHTPKNIDNRDLQNQESKATEEKSQFESKMVQEKGIDCSTERKDNPSNLSQLSKMVYNNRGALRSREGGVIRQPSLLLRQIFANSESYEVKKMLTNLLMTKQPSESLLTETIAVIKQFTDWAASQQEKSHVRLVPRPAPILDEHSWVGDVSVHPDSLEGQLKKEEWLNVEQWIQRPGHRESDALSVLSSNQSEYEGFISK